MRTNKSARELFYGKTVALIGAGVSNMPLIPFIISLGGTVTVRDKKSEDALRSRAGEIRAAGASLITGDGYLDSLREDIIIRSPGIRPDIPEFAAARERGSIITSEMELFLENSPCPVYAVTGSDGKSTTTTILSKLLEPEGSVYLGGNIGEALFHKVYEMDPNDAVAVELSSFQLMEADVPVEAAVITNVTPNHLNWHTGMDEYIAAKRNLLRRAGRAVLNYDNEVTRQIACETVREGKIPVTLFSLSPAPNGTDADKIIFLDGDNIVLRDFPAGKPRDTVIMKDTDILLPGRHNIANYMAAVGAAWEMTSPEKIKEVAASFGGVKHRLQLISESRGIRCYNSSIDSSPTRTAAALSALSDSAPDRKIVIICGGCDKNIPFEPLAEALYTCPPVKAVVLTGATRSKLADALEFCPEKIKKIKPDLTVTVEPEFDSAVLAALSLAEPGETVLLSPACASFDAFPNFEVRGERFCEIVRRWSRG